MNTFTPGPWTATGSEMSATVWVADIKNRRVCSVKRCDNDFDNAKLIAAAPDLYAALQACVESFQSVKPQGQPTDSIIGTAEMKARAALAKVN